VYKRAEHNTALKTSLINASVDESRSVICTHC